MPNGRTATSSSPRKAPVSAAAARRSLPLFAPSAERCSGQAGSDDDTEGGALRPAGFHGGAASQMVADRSRTHTVDRFVGFGHRETQENARKFPSPAPPAASCGSPATSAARRRRAHVPGECSPPCGTASQGRYRRTDLGSARPQRLRQSGSPKPHRTRIAPPAATFRNVPKADPPAARADNLRISIRRPPAPADCGEEVRRQELPEGAGKGCTGTRTAAMRPEKPMLRKDTTTHPETHRTETGAPARAAGRDRKRMCRNSHRGNAAGKADAAQRHDNPPRNPPNRDKGAPPRQSLRAAEIRPVGRRRKRTRIAPPEGRKRTLRPAKRTALL